MDSGNSGESAQSSSGGAGRADVSFSALINSNKRRAINHGGFQAGNDNPLIYNPANFDLQPNFFETISPPLNLDMAPRSVRPLHHVIKPTPSSYPHPFFGSFSTATTTTAAAAEPPSAPEQIRRNPKKRTRASRRAPTTVLTTDTSNFRSMVQEFTGIPAPPFPASPFFRLNTQKLDLYGTATPSSFRSNPLDSSQTPSYLTRPTPPPFLTSSMLDLDHHSNFQLPNATAPNVRAGGVTTDQFGHHVINASSLVTGPQFFRSNHVQQQSNELNELQPTGR